VGISPSSPGKVPEKIRENAGKMPGKSEKYPKTVQIIEQKCVFMCFMRFVCILGGLLIQVGNSLAL
jgi:hypothetical protein